MCVLASVKCAKVSKEYIWPESYFTDNQIQIQV